MADDGQVKIGIYVDNEGVKASMDEAVRTVQDGTDKMADAAEDAGKKIDKSVTKGFDTAKLQQNFKAVEGQIKSFAKTIALTATGFGVWVNQSANSIDRIDKMSQKLGLSRKAFQELDYAAGQTGLSVESLSASMRPLVNAVNSGSESFKKLGVSLKDANGNLKSQEDLFFEVVNKLADMPASVERSTIGFELLGRNFQTLNPLLNKGSAGIEELRKRFQSLGIEISDKTVDDFVDFKDTLSDFGKTLKNSFNNAIKGSIPQLKQFIEGMTKMLAPGGRLYDMIGKLAEVLTNFVTNVLPPLLDAFIWILDNATLVAAGITAVAVALKALTGNWVGAIASGLIGIFSTVLISRTKKTADGIDDASGSLKKFGDIVVDTTGDLDKLKVRVKEVEEALRGYEQELEKFSTFDAITHYDEFAKLQEKITGAKEAIKEYNEAIDKLNSSQAANDAMEEEILTFEDYTKAVDNAEQALKDFIARNATLKGGFDANLLDTDKLIEYNVLKQNVDETKRVLGTLQGAFEDTDAFEKWTEALKGAEDELKSFVDKHSDLEGGFDLSVLTEDEAKQFNALKANVEKAQKALDSVNDTLKTTKEVTEDSEDSFEQWTKALDEAEKKLKQFIAEKSDINGGFNIDALSAEDLATYNELKAQVTKAQKALESMNDAMRDTNKELEITEEKIENTDAFEKWTKAVKDAEEALKDFIAVHAEENGGKFDVDALTDSERVKFEKLKQAVTEAKEQLQSLQDATNTTTEDMSDKLVNVADTIASAWAKIGLALGNGIEAALETLTNGESQLKAAGFAFADAMTATLSAVGDALIQAGIAKKVVENLSAVSGSYAIAMGLAIKAAAGTIKGLFDKLKEKEGFEHGGIVGGTSYTGDRILARVNSGEMILNRRQQQQLFALANGKGVAGAGMGSNIQIINNAGDQVTAEQSLDGRAIKIMVEKFASNMLRGVKGSKLMGQTYGIRQLGRH